MSRNTIRRSLTATGAALTLALVGAACAGDDDTDADDVVDSVADAVDDATSDTIDTADSDATVEAALTDPTVEESVTTFLTLASNTDELPGDGEVTLFVPTDAAFAAAAIENLDALIDDPAMIGDVLSAHAVEGVAMSTDLSDGDTLTPVLGDDVTVSVGDDGSVMIGEATVVQADIEFDGGVIHIIDGVIMLPA